MAGCGSAADLEPLDAFIQRFGSLQDALQGPVFRGIAALEGFEPAKSPRELMDRMERLGIIGDAAAWFDLRRLRNVLAHEYPNERDVQARRLNEAYAAIDTLLAVVDRVREHAGDRKLADLSGFPALPVG